MDWTAADIPPQQGRVVVITGATSGLGLETALRLATAGAEVVLTGRNAEKGGAALEIIRGAHPAAVISYMDLDLASLEAVGNFVDAFSAKYESLDLLVNNAGVMMPPARHTTRDGFELQFGANYLGHFALTAGLLPRLRLGRQPRVVHVSSLAHRLDAAIHFDDLQWERHYKAWPAYAQSKLANLMFMLEVQRRGEAQGWGVMSNAAHPGWARTGLQSSGPRMGLDRPSLVERAGSWIEPLLSQSAADGALPSLYAACSPQAEPAGYYGPRGLGELKGPVGPARIARAARDKAVAARLWDVSEQLITRITGRPVFAA